jgi:hypothetical protein
MWSKIDKTFMVTFWPVKTQLKGTRFMKLQLHDKCSYLVFIKIDVSDFDKEMGMLRLSREKINAFAGLVEQKWKGKVNLPMNVFTLTCF